MNTAPPHAAPTALSICNLALAKLGEAPIGAILPNGSPAARLCYTHYHPVRREILCTNRWTFASSQVTLTNDSTTPAPPYTEHRLPNNCLRVLEVSSNDWSLRGRCIYCPERQITLLYIADVEDPTLFDPLFIDAFATRLACKLCIPLTSSTTAREALTQEYHRLALPQAAHLNAVQAYSNDSHPLHKILSNSLTNNQIL